MSVFIEFAVLGIFAGALNSLLAVGMVVAYRGSRVVNFAQGAFAMVGAYVFFDLHVTHGQSYAVSFVLGVAASAALSAAMHFGFLNRLRNAPQLTKIIVTLAFLELLTQAGVIWEPPVTEFVPASLPTTPVKVLSAHVPAEQIYVLGIVVLIALALGAVYRYTQLGRATTAALDNPRALSGLGYSPSRVAGLNWLLSGCLSGVAGILLAPISGLSVATYSLLVLPALAAAVFGRFSSITLAVVGGLIIGVMQSEMGYYIKTPGWSDAVPFILIIVILVGRGIGKVSRSAPAQRLPQVGTGAIKLRLVLPTLVILLVITQVVHDQFWLSAIVVTAGSAIVLLSFVIITGYSGQLSLCQFAFAGLGAWIAGKLVDSAGVPLVPAVLIGIVAVVPIGILLGIVCLRTSGVNLAILTLGFAVAVEYLIFDSSQWTGVAGIQLPTLRLFGLNVSAIDEPSRYAALAVIALFAASVVTANVRRGVAGRRLLALRANERAAASLGVDVTRAKVFAFAIGSMIAALGGIVIGFANSTIVFSTFSTLPSILAVAQAIIGGVGWIPGASIGGLGQPGGLLSQALDTWAGSNYVQYVPLAFAVLLLLVIVKQPDGAAPVIAGQLRWLAGKVGIRLDRPAPPASELVVPAVPAKSGEKRSHVRPEKLEVSELTVTFGGTVAVDKLSLEVNPGEIVGLIGPNGAGKSTAIDAITGFVPCRVSSLTLAGLPVANLSPSLRARAGVRRSFQSLELFDDLSVLDNLAIATDPPGTHYFFTSAVKPQRLKINDVTREAINAFKLADVLDKKPGELTYGTRRLVAIARAVAAGPSVLLLDEPAAGLDDSERHELSDVLVELAQDWEMGILLVEHDVPMVMRTCQRVYALDLGRLIASGTAAEVRGDAQVIKAFLGSEEAGELV